jgi:hypothetical protein
MIYWGFFFSVLTLPGVVMHAFASMWFCRKGGVPVYEVCLVRASCPCCYVVHGESPNFGTSFLIAAGPFIVNTLLCVLLCFPSYLRVQVWPMDDPVSFLLMYVGLSAGINAFPSTADADNLWEQASLAATGGNALAMLSMPLVLFMYVMNLGRFFWLDYLYGIGIGFFLPGWILGRLT